MSKFRNKRKKMPKKCPEGECVPHYERAVGNTYCAKCNRWMYAGDKPPANTQALVSPEPQKVGKFSLEVFQHDWIPGFAAFHDDGQINETAKAHVVLNLGSLMAAIKEGDLPASKLPYMVAESLMHEAIHALEAWAGVEFSEDRVEELLSRYREKYQRDTVWEYTGAAPEGEAKPSGAQTNWTPAELESFGKLASEEQPKPTEHLIRAMSPRPPAEAQEGAREFVLKYGHPDERFREGVMIQTDVGYIAKIAEAYANWRLRSLPQAAPAEIERPQEKS